MLWIYSAVPFLLGCQTVSDTDTAELGTWRLVWSDEFDGSANTAPDPTVWTHDVGGNGWGNGQLEYNTDRTDNVRLTGEGMLEIAPTHVIKCGWRVLL